MGAEKEEHVARRHPNEPLHQSIVRASGTACVLLIVERHARCTLRTRAAQTSCALGVSVVSFTHRNARNAPMATGTAIMAATASCVTRANAASSSGSASIFQSCRSVVILIRNGSYVSLMAS